MAQFELVVNQVNFEEEEITQSDELKCFGDLYSCDTDLLENNSSESHPIKPKRVNIIWDAERNSFVREGKIVTSNNQETVNFSLPNQVSNVSKVSDQVNGDSFSSFVSTANALALHKSFIGNIKEPLLPKMQESPARKVNAMSPNVTASLSEASSSPVSSVSNGDKLEHVTPSGEKRIPVGHNNMLPDDGIFSRSSDDAKSRTPASSPSDRPLELIRVPKHSITIVKERAVKLPATDKTQNTVEGRDPNVSDSQRTLNVSAGTSFVKTANPSHTASGSNQSHHRLERVPDSARAYFSPPSVAQHVQNAEGNSRTVFDKQREAVIASHSSPANQHVENMANIVRVSLPVLANITNSGTAEANLKVKKDLPVPSARFSDTVDGQSFKVDEKAHGGKQLMSQQQLTSQQKYFEQSPGEGKPELAELSTSKLSKRGEPDQFVNAAYLNNTQEGEKVTSAPKTDSAEVVTTSVDVLQMELRKLKKEKSWLEGQLEVMQAELRGTLTERSALQTQLATLAHKLDRSEFDVTEMRKERAVLELEIDKLRQDRERLEQAVLEFHQMKEAKDAEIAALEDDLLMTKGTNEKLQLRIRELKQDVAGRDSTVNEMKRKVAELGVQYQTAEQNRVLVEGELKAQRAEVGGLKTSKEWQRTQLDKAQEAKAELRREVTKLKGDMVAQMAAAERLKAECSRYKNQLIDVQERALHDKEALARHLEAIEADMVENEAAFASVRQERDALLRRLQQLGEGINSAGVVASQVTELEEKMRRLEGDLRTAKQQLASTERSHSESSKRLALAQEAILERDRAVFDMDRRCQEMEKKLGEMKTLFENERSETRRVEEAKTAVEQELAVIRGEKQMFDGALQTFRSDMAKVEASFRSLKQELAAKTKEVDELRAREMSRSDTFRQNEQQGNLDERVASENIPDVLLSREMGSGRSVYDNQQFATVKAELDSSREECLKLQRERDELAAEVGKLRLKDAELTGHLEGMTRERKQLAEYLEHMTQDRKQLAVQFELLAAEKEKLLAQSSNQADDNPSSAYAQLFYQHTLLQGQLEHALRERSEREVQLEQVWREKVEREKHLQELGQQVALQTEWFKAHMAAAEKKIVELSAAQNQQQSPPQVESSIEELELQLERERSKLAGLQQAHAALKEHATRLEAQLAGHEALSSEVGSGLHWELQKRDRQIVDLQDKARSMQAELDREKQANKDAKKQLLVEKAAAVKSRRQLEEMWTAQDQSQTELEQLRRGAEGWREERGVLTEQLQLNKDETARLTAELRGALAQLETLQHEIEEARVREALLQEKVETQDWQMNNKMVEAEGVKQQLVMTEERLNKEVELAQHRTQVLSGEVASHREELNTVRSVRAALHNQVIELRAALQSVINQHKLHSAGGTDVAFSAVDFEHLLKGNFSGGVSVQNRSLSFLQGTLAGLRGEISSLQSQMEAHSSAVHHSQQVWSELEGHVQELHSLCQTSAADRAASEQLVAEGQRLLSAHSSSVAHPLATGSC